MNEHEIFAVKHPDYVMSVSELASHMMEIVRKPVEEEIDELAAGYLQRLAEAYCDIGNIDAVQRSALVEILDTLQHNLQVREQIADEKLHDMYATADAPTHSVHGSRWRIEAPNDSGIS